MFVDPNTHSAKNTFLADDEEVAAAERLNLLYKLF